ncbi:IS21 family transposase [Pseudomonas aeruginosa]|uniref:IS21 family transposase n=1 Tax=Pseudomonas aeruginosa TaxID=287 RepID=UPI0009AB8820|nr:IS21 family transposase [Pseudomonas aeruginosa]MDP5764869.1 IS21 family transposase [Pseudomonas aeruginosa]
MKIPIAKQREIVRLLSYSNLTHRAIGKLARVSHNTVRALRDQLTLTDQTWGTLEALDDAAFARRLQTGAATGSPRKAVPEWHEVHEQLRRPDMTLELLWQEFREQEPNGVSYAQFTRHYRRWLKKQKLSMRQVHLPGDKLFVDFCGRTIPIVDQATGKISQAQVFVATMGCSGYLYAVAVASQTTRDWLHCHVQALAHLDGVPRFVVPDNLKAAVISAQREQLQLNRAYAELADHYGFTILPARPRRPQDKSLAEVGVQIVQRWVLARLRHHTFFSIDELNRQLKYWMAQLNQRTTRTYAKSRLARFQEFDLPALGTLPERHYDFHQWRYQVRVGADYHVEFERHQYSVPYQHAHQMVDLRVNADWLEVVYQRRVIATHRLNSSSGVSTLSEHLAPNHRHFQEGQPHVLLEWARQVGPATQTFVQRNLEERQQFATGLRAVVSLRQMLRKEQISTARLESACSYALTLGTLSVTRLRAILRNEADLRRTQSQPVVPVEHANIRGAAYYAAQPEEIA